MDIMIVIHKAFRKENLVSTFNPYIRSIPNEDAFTLFPQFLDAFIRKRTEVRVG